MGSLPLSAEYYPTSVLTPDQVASVVSHDLVELLNHNLSEAVFRCNMNGEVLYFNDALQRLFDIPFDQAAGLNASDFYMRRSRLATVNRHLNGRAQSFEGEVEFVKASGETFYGYLNCRRVGRGAVFYIDGAIREITHEKLARRSMKKQARMQKLLLDVSSSFLNADLDHIGETVLEALGWVGRLLAIHRIQVHTYDFEASVCNLTFTWVHEEGVPITTPEPVSLDYLQEMVLLHQKGEVVGVASVESMEEGQLKEELQRQGVRGFLTVPMKSSTDCAGFISFETLKSPFPEFDESVLGMLKLFSNMVANLSSRSASHLRLTSLVEEVTMKSQQQKDFSFITSHHLRASVANLVALADLMQRRNSSRYLDMLAITVEKLNSSINSITSILQLEQYELLRKSPTSIQAALHRVCESLQPVLDQEQIDLIDSVAPDLTINALPNYLDDILAELIKNSIRFGTNESSKQILVVAKQVRDQVRIEVTDFGKGFDSKKHEAKLFQIGTRFQNGGTGQGVGLYLARRQVETLGGSIEIYSRENEGTSVKMTFSACEKEL